MARKPAAKKAAKSKTAPKGRGKKETRKARRGPLRWLFSWFFRLSLTGFALMLIATLFYAIFNPITTPYMIAERHRLGHPVDQVWVPLEEISPHMARAVVAAEDANFCLHWGFDMEAIRDALEAGARRGGSTISQQTVKNAYLWQGRSWVRKAMEAVMTPLVELVWSKRRIMEVYLNIVEFDEGVFGVDAAAHHYFGVAPKDLSRQQAARLAVVLPNPKERSAARPTQFLRRQAARAIDGAATIRADGRSACFDA